MNSSFGSWAPPRWLIQTSDWTIVFSQLTIDGSLRKYGSYELAYEVSTKRYVMLHTYPRK